VKSLSELVAGEAIAASARYGVTVPRELVLAVIGIESHGDTMAVRREGDGALSRGLMQVKESTARELGLKDPLQLHLPDVGVHYGTAYLAKQLTRYGGRIPTAVAAYNAGSARYTQQERFINQGYVDKVMARFQQLRRGASPALWIGLAAVAGVGLWAASERSR